MAEKLIGGDKFPAMTLQLVGGGSMDVATSLKGRYNFVIFYRGHW